jgi:hypothetical protein
MYFLLVYELPKNGREDMVVAVALMNPKKIGVSTIESKN